MNRPSKYSHNASIALTKSHDEVMMFDEDSSSRDSGISEMMDDNTPVCFSSLRFQSTTTQNEDSIESMEIDENTAPARSSDTQMPCKKKKVTFRRQKSSCQVRLFDVSPDSHAQFRIPPAPLTFRSENFKIPENHRILQQLNRKRRMEQNHERSSDHYHLDAISVDIDDEDTERCIENTEMDETEESVSHRFHAPTLVPNVKRKCTLVRSATTYTLRENDEEIETDDPEPSVHHLHVEYHLQTVENESSTSFRRITAETLRDLMDTLPEEEFLSKYILIDCRYPFEYEAGHIKTAINFYDRDKVSTIFYDKEGRKLHGKIPIFYCEFSQARGPKMAYALRESDRKRNIGRYPRCDYEEMYVLNDGYRSFFRAAEDANNMNLCEPHAYIEMEHKAYARELKKYNFHNKGQSVFRSQNIKPFKSLSSFFKFDLPANLDVVSSESSKSISPGEKVSHEPLENQSTPAMPRGTSNARRYLFADATSSPTNFGQPYCGQQTPSPHKKVQICDLAFT